MEEQLKQTENGILELFRKHWDCKHLLKMAKTGTVSNPKEILAKTYCKGKDQQRQIHLQLATNQMKSEMNIMKIKAEDYEHQSKTTDLQMISEIDDILQNSTRLQEIA